MWISPATWPSLSPWNSGLGGAVRYSGTAIQIAPAPTGADIFGDDIAEHEGLNLPIPPLEPKIGAFLGERELRGSGAQKLNPSGGTLGRATLN